MCRFLLGEVFGYDIAGTKIGRQKKNFYGRESPERQLKRLQCMCCIQKTQVRHTPTTTTTRFPENSHGQPLSTKPRITPEHFQVSAQTNNSTVQIEIFCCCCCCFIYIKCIEFWPDCKNNFLRTVLIIRFVWSGVQKAESHFSIFNSIRFLFGIWPPHCRRATASPRFHCKENHGASNSSRESHSSGSSNTDHFASTYLYFCYYILQVNSAVRATKPKPDTFTSPTSQFWGEQQMPKRSRKSIFDPKLFHPSPILPMQYCSKIVSCILVLSLLRVQEHLALYTNTQKTFSLIT